MPGLLAPSRRGVAHLGRAFLLVVLLAGFLAAIAGRAAAATPVTQGIFENCPMVTAMDTCIQRLGVMHSGGLRVVVIAPGAPADDVRYAAAAQALGMQVMWAISDPGWWQNTSLSADFSGFQAVCGCTTNAQLLSFVIHSLGSLPATYGYYAADDSMLSAGDAGNVSRYAAAIKAADPAHQVILSSADEQQTAQYQSIGDMNAAELYPVTTDSLTPVAANQGMWDGVGQNAADDQRMADQAGKSSAFILQAFTFGDNVDDGQAVGVCSPSDTKWSCAAKLQYPNETAQLALRNEILRHAHPKLILWWNFPGTFGQADNDTYSLYPTGTTAASRWAGLKAAITAPLPGQPKPRVVRARTASAKKKVRAHAARAKKSAKRHSRRVTHRRLTATH